MSAVEAAWSTLPTWVRWAPPLAMGCLAFLGAWGSTFLVSKLALRSARTTAPWTVLAAELWPARLAAGGALALAGFAAVGASLVLDDALGAELHAGRAVVLGALAVSGGVLGHRPILARMGMGGPLTPLERTRGLAFSFLRVGPVLLLVGLVLWSAQGGLQRALALWVVWGVSGWAFAAGWVASLFQRVGLVSAPDERLTRLVAGVVAEAGLPPPEVAVLHTAHANAWALPGGPALHVTTRLLRECDDAELRGVLAHEAGHLAEPRPVRLARFAQTVGLGALLLPIPLLREVGAGAALIWLALAGFGWAVARRLLRGAEGRADRFAVEHGGDPPAYARALEKIYRANFQPAVLPGRRPHGDLYDRMVHAGVTPDWPRPAPPVARRGLVRVALFLVAVGAMGLPWLLVGAVRGAESPVGSLVLVGLGSRSGEDFAQAGTSGGSPGALALFLAAATEVEPWSTRWPVALAELDAKVGDCEGAVAALRLASARLAGGAPEDEAYARVVGIVRDCLR